MNLLKSTLVASLLLVTNASVMADAPLPPASTGWSWGVNVDQLNIDKDTAWYNWVDSQAYVIGFSAEHYNSANDFTYSIGADLVSFNDQTGAGEYTTKGYKEYDTSGVLLYIDAGSKIRFGDKGSNFFNARVGVNTLVGAERSIGNCVDCPSYDIDIDGGLYGIVGVGHSFNSFDVTLNFKQYFSGDLDNSLGLKFSTTF